MLPYVFGFALSLLAFSIAVAQSNSNRKVTAFFTVLSSLPLALLASMRDLDMIGPDTLLYGYPVFSAVSNTESLQDAFDASWAAAYVTEPGYVTWNFVISRFSDSVEVFFFSLAMLNALIVAIAILLARRLGPPTLMWLTYLLTVYLESFNLLRQTPALLLGVLGVVLIIRKRPWLGLAVGLLGWAFHGSGFLFICLWVPTFILTRVKPVFRNYVLLLLGSALMLPLSSKVLDYIAAGGMGRYSDYLDGTYALSGNAAGVETLYRLAPVLVGLIALLLTKKSGASGTPIHGSDNELRTRAVFVFSALLTIEVLLLPFREVAYPIYRFIAIFGVVKIVAYGVFANAGSAKIRHVLIAVFVAFDLLYFYIIFDPTGEGAYRSEILEGLIGPYW